MARIAAAQRGLVRRSQLSQAGIGRGAVAHRLQSGSLHRVAPAVFAVGHPALAPLAHETAALLYAGDDCVLSHASAAVLWGLVPAAPEEVDVTAVARRVRPSLGLRVHRVAEIDSRDVRIRHGLPVTAPARTLIDAAPALSGDALERAVTEARVLELVTDQQLQDAIARCPLRPGVGRLRALLSQERGPALTRSGAERRLRMLVERGELPWPQFNVWLHGYLVDAVWAGPRVAVEVDGYAVHGHRHAFERDRKRDQTLAAHGYLVIRVTARQLRSEPMAVLARLAQALALAARREPDGQSGRAES